MRAVARELHSRVLGLPETSMYLLLKFVLSAAIVVAVSEIARRSTLYGQRTRVTVAPAVIDLPPLTGKTLILQ